MSEQPQQPPQAEEEAQIVEEEGPSLAELTVPPPPKDDRGKGRGKKGKARDKRKRRGKKHLLFYLFLVPFIFLVPLFLVPLSANLKMVIFGIKLVPQI